MMSLQLNATKVCLKCIDFFFQSRDYVFQKQHLFKAMVDRNIINQDDKINFLISFSDMLINFETADELHKEGAFRSLQGMLDNFTQIRGFSFSLMPNPPHQKKKKKKKKKYMRI